MANALKQHIEQCPKHPMSALKKSLAAAEKRERELREKVERYEALLDAPVVWEREVTKPQPR